MVAFKIGDVVLEVHALCSYHGGAGRAAAPQDARQYFNKN
jgi:hypothetical protein